MTQLVFVFGSNRAGRHGKGSALHALQKWGAIRGQGEGLQGASYAIPTKGWRMEVLPLSEIMTHVDIFFWFARRHREMTFKVVRIGCGLAGYTEQQIAPLFKNAPDNCILPDGWRD